jgi:hypothetical protein
VLQAPRHFVGPVWPRRHEDVTAIYVFLDPHLVLPEIAEIVLIHEAFVGAKVPVCENDFPCIVPGEPAKPWHGVVLLTDTKPMEMEVRPVEADLQDYVALK